MQAWVADARRTALAIPGLPYLAAGFLSAAAVAEPLVRGDASGSRLLISLVLAIAATAPLAVLAAHWLAPATVLTAAFVSLFVQPRLVAAGAVALVATFYHLGRHRPGWLTAAALAPFALFAIGQLVGDSGPAEADHVVSGPAPAIDESPPDRSEAAEPDLSPLLLTGASVAAAGVGLTRRARTTEVRLEAQEATAADEILAHSARGERARIARELHDVVAHRISTIAVQAETARLTTTGLSPDGARQLLAIGDTARDALAEMRSLLGVLRKDVDESAGRQPQPGIAQLGQLVTEARELTGAMIRLTVSGRMAPLDPSVELTAYRIVQESLTNARRHAPGSPVDVELEYGAETLRVLIRDAGPGSVEAAGGLGLLGMRERVAAVGGRLAVESGRSGGFVVDATLPRVAVHRSPAWPETSHG